jgi:hypothetical protein
MFDGTVFLYRWVWKIDLSKMHFKDELCFVLGVLVESFVIVADEMLYFWRDTNIPESSTNSCMVF